MKRYFLPANYKQTVYELFLLKQGSRSTEKYSEDLLDLTIWNHVHESDAQKATRYKVRLRVNHLINMQKSRVWNFEEACQLILKLKVNMIDIPSGLMGSLPLDLHPSNAPQESYIAFNASVSNKQHRACFQYNQSNRREKKKASSS